MIVRRIRWKLSLLVPVIIIIAACRHDKWNPDVSGIKADIKIERIDNEIFSMDSSRADQQIAAFTKRHPDLAELLFTRLFRFGNPNDPVAVYRFKHDYAFEPYMKDSLFRDIQKSYTTDTISWLENEFEDAFKHLRYYYPKDSFPKVYFMVAGFGYQAITYGNDLVVSPEMFMGPDYRFYRDERLNFAEYQVKRFKKQYIVPVAMKAIFERKYEEHKLTDQTLLSGAIYAGKRLFFLDAMMPNTPDTLKIEFTGRQLKWCKDNEPEIWNHFITKDLLFTTDQYKLAKYLADGPYTTADGVPPESAPRLGEWVGWQIIKHYMENNPEVTLDEMCRDKDYRKILNLSKYKPKI